MTKSGLQTNFQVYGGNALVPPAETGGSPVEALQASLATALAPQIDRALKPVDAAQFLRLIAKPLANMRWRGDGPPLIKGPGRRGSVRYTLSDLVAWRDAHRRASTSDTGGDHG